MSQSVFMKIPMMVMQQVWRWTRGLTLGVQCCLIDETGHVMLVRHGYRPGWHFPGGGVERHETVLEALERELQEEVAVRLDADPQLFAPYSNAKHFTGDHVLLYVARQWTQVTVPKPNFEIAEIKRFAPDDLPADIHPPTRQRINDVLDNTAPSRHWHVKS